MEKALLEEHVRYGEARFRDKELVRPFVNRIYQDLAELEEAMKLKTCEGCDNNHKDRTIFYDGKKALMCTFCKYGAVSYFKPKDNA